MFDLLVYLFENHYEAGIRPDRHLLTQELHAAGFNHADIESALSWFGVFDQPAGQLPAATPGQGLRIYSGRECAKLGSDSLSFLLQQEQVGALNPLLREFVIDRAMALPARQASAARRQCAAALEHHLALNHH